MAARSPVVRHSRNSNRKKAKRIKESGKNNVRQAGKRPGAKKTVKFKICFDDFIERMRDVSFGPGFVFFVRRPERVSSFFVGFSAKTGKK